MNTVQKELFQDLMNLVNEQDSPFYFVEHQKDGHTFRVFNYRLASYSDFIKPNALECRGIMFLMDGNDAKELVSLPPKKFFNYKENPLVMDIDFSKTELIMDKRDGSIMTTYRVPNDNRVYLKSKTSLTSSQAVAANAHLNSSKCANLYSFLEWATNEGFSVTLEWTSPNPEHRIVIGYDEDALTVLCVRDMETLDYVPFEYIVDWMQDFDCEKDNLVNTWIISPKSNIEHFVENIRHGKGIEGYVILADGVYTKHKTDWYCALHHNKDSVNSDKRLFETVVNEAHDDLRSMFFEDTSILKRIDEMEGKVKKIYADIHENVNSFYEKYKDLSRKDYAITGQAELSRLYFSLAMNLYLGKENNYKEWMLKHYKELGIKDDPISSDQD